METLPEITEALCKALREDEEFYRGYKDNIAMAFVDEFNRYSEDYVGNVGDMVLYHIANQAAKNFLDMWIGIKNKE